MMILPELGYGVPNVLTSTPWTVATTGAIYPTLVGGNAFTMRKVPIREIIRSADGGNRRKFVVGSRRVYQGTLNTLLHPDQGPFWQTALQTSGFDMATGQATIAAGAVTGVTITQGGAGYPSTGTVPVSFFGGGGYGAYGTATITSGAVTAVAITAGGASYTSIPGVQIGGMPSYTLFYWDGTQFWQFNGACVQSATITAAAQQDYASISVNWVAQQRAMTNGAGANGGYLGATPAWPAATSYSPFNPYLFIETAGQCFLKGYLTGPAQTIYLTNYRQMSFSLNNVLQGTWDEQPYISSLLYCGRDMDFSIGPQYIGQLFPTSVSSATIPPQTLRQDFENQTPVTFQLEFNHVGPPAHTFTINAETNSYISNIQDDIPLDNASYQNCTVQAFIDSTTALGSDFVLTAT
jgi:hypothetical protein